MFVNFTQTVISVPCRLRNALDGDRIGYPGLYITFKPFKFVLTVNYLDRGQGRLLASSCFGRLRRTEQMIVQPIWPITTKIFLAEKNISCGKNIFLAEKNIFLAEKNIFLAEKKIFLAEKNISCGEKYFLRRKIFLAEKYISCGEKYISCGENIFLAERNIFLAEKKFFLAEKYISCGEKYISCGEKFFLRKNIFCTMLPISFRNIVSRNWYKIWWLKRICYYIRFNGDEM